MRASAPFLRLLLAVQLATASAAYHPPLSAISSVAPRAHPLLSEAAMENDALLASKLTPTPTASVGATTINLAKNIVGSGVLALAAGVASFSSTPAAALPAFLLLIMMCSLSAYTFSSIARVSDAVGASSYRDAWTKIFGARTALLPALIIIFKTMSGALAYAIILGDSFASMATRIGAAAPLQMPNVWIGLVSTCVLLPLCLMRDLSSLAFGSVLGTAGTIYTALFMLLRYVDGSYAAGGKFNSAIAAVLRPKFTSIASAPILNSQIFVLVSMLATAFLAHYNAPKFYVELAPPKDGGSKMFRFNLAVAGGFGMAALLCGAIMVAGFLTFGASAQGLILNNYATADALAFVARLGIASSVLFSYPLLFLGLRDGILSALGLSKAAARPGVHRVSTVALIALVNGAACVLKDLGLIVALGGAVLGSTLVYILPALMSLRVARRTAAAPAGTPGKLKPMELGLNYALVGLGGALAVAGAVTSLRGAAH
jgi:sodium-coupled neutral amino acid transporter 11